MLTSSRLEGGDARQPAASAASAPSHARAGVIAAPRGASGRGPPSAHPGARPRSDAAPPRAGPRDLPEVEVGLGAPRLEREPGEESGLRLLEPAERPERGSEPDVGLRSARPACDNAPEERERLLGPRGAQ